MPNLRNSQFRLFLETRFRPFFFTQFLGAFNDNLFKNALILLVTFQISLLTRQQIDQLVNLAALLFILPFFLFSGLAGQLADKFEKSHLIRIIKFSEILIMLLGAVAYHYQSIPVLLITLFLMGTQSSFFGPIKYSILPQHLKSSELIEGNAHVEMGTFIAILLGTLAGLISQTQHGFYLVPALIIIFALLGWFSSLAIPPAPAANEQEKINWNIFSQSIKTIQYAKQNQSVFIAIIGISWFWFLGAAYLTQFPNYSKEVLHAQAPIVSLLLSSFSIGIAVGSLLCSKISNKKLELGLVPIGAIGLLFFGTDLYFSSAINVSGNLSDLAHFISKPQSIRILLDLLLIGVFGGLYIVPLYTLVQLRCAEVYRSQVIAAINILNSLFMVLSAALGIVLLGFVELTIPQFFLILSLLNIFVVVYLCVKVPEFGARMLLLLLNPRSTRDRLNVVSNTQGPTLLICAYQANGLNALQVLAMTRGFPKPITPIIDEKWVRNPFLGFIFKSIGAALIDSSNKQNIATLTTQYNQIESKNELTYCYFYPDEPDEQKPVQLTNLLQRLPTNSTTIFPMLAYTNASRANQTKEEKENPPIWKTTLSIFSPRLNLELGKSIKVDTNRDLQLNKIKNSLLALKGRLE